LEFDTPQALLLDADSQFSSLVEQTGAAEADYLRLLASVPLSKVKSNDRKPSIDDSDGLSLDDAENIPFLE
jgi:hypothetical protein